MNTDWYEQNNISLEESVGIDEVGRGPLAGPVVAASMWVDSYAAQQLVCDGIKVCDSKKMTAIQRRRVIEWIGYQSEETLHYAIGQATVEEIDRLNILQASMLAMERSYKALGIQVVHVLVDGNRAPNVSGAHPIVGGDGKVLAIALASIVAKEYRDDYMRGLALEYPNYGWETNVGYGSEKHLKAIGEHGITVYHRRSFAPIHPRLI
ncbi:MAG: ribonuclease HII [Holosporaceae bacterium]|jgi:ribonuclease HII|nr:ribonuclease HII [Holosporaceae bacterium]